MCCGHTYKCPVVILLLHYSVLVNTYSKQRFSVSCIIMVMLITCGSDLCFYNTLLDEGYCNIIAKLLFDW